MIPAAIATLLDAPDWPGGLWRAAVPARDDAAALWPEEWPAIARARPARRADFIAGRIAARAALAQMGLAPAGIAQGADRAPVWPDGVCGSITHSGGVAIAVVGRVADWDGLGLDLEPDEPAPPDLAATILRPDETANALTGDPLAAFSAKEAVFKAQFPTTGAMLDFAAARLGPGGADLVDAGGGAGLPPGWRGRRLPMRQWRAAGWILSLCAVPARA